MAFENGQRARYVRRLRPRDKFVVATVACTILSLTHDIPFSSMSQKRFEERTEWVYDEQAFPLWNASFAKNDRADMIRDDLWAGRSIAVLLAVLVAIGLVLAIVTVTFVASWQ
jgi:hypothetical protein